MVAVFALVGETLLQPSSQLLPLATLRLRKTLRGLAQFVGVCNLLATGQRQEMTESLDQYRTAPVPSVGIPFGCVSMHRHRYQPEARLTIRPHLNLPRRDVLLVKADRPMPGTWIRVPN